MDRYLSWAQPIVTAASLIFGGGVLYGDVRELKQDVVRSGELDKQVQVMEVKIQTAEKAQQQTVEALEKVVLVVDRLNTSVAKLEAKLER